MTEQKTLGKILCPEGIIANLEADKILWPIYAANSIEQIEDVLFVLKRGHKATRDCAIVLEKIFKDLIDGLTTRITQWYTPQEGCEDASAFVRDCRERIGHMALEVFFDAVFDRDREAFWRYLSLNENYQWVPNRPPGRGLSTELNPVALCIYLKYFSVCNEATKKSHKTKIRKFLQFALNKPLVAKMARDEFEAILPSWTRGARQDLANALIANGMYEECLDFDLPESYKPLLYKFLGGFQETDNGLVKLPLPEMPSTITSNLPLSWEDALHKSCENKEWGHLLGVLVRIGIKHGRIKAGSPLAFMEDFSKELGQAHYGPAIQANNLVLHFVNPPCMARN